MAKELKPATKEKEVVKPAEVKKEVKEEVKKPKVIATKWFNQQTRREEIIYTTEDGNS